MWVRWVALIEVISPYYTEEKTGWPSFSLQTMLRAFTSCRVVHAVRSGHGESLFDTPLYRDFAQLEEFGSQADERTILRFRHRLEKHKLAEQVLCIVNDILTQHGLLLNRLLKFSHVTFLANIRLHGMAKK